MTSPEVTALGLAAILQSGQILLAAAMNRDAGLAYNAGPRDTPVALSPLAGRLRRALANHFEAVALFTIAVVAVTLSGKASGLAAACAWSISRRVSSMCRPMRSAGRHGALSSSPPASRPPF